MFSTLTPQTGVAGLEAVNDSNLTTFQAGYHCRHGAGLRNSAATNGTEFAVLTFQCEEMKTCEDFGSILSGSHRSSPARRDQNFMCSLIKYDTA